MAAQGNAMVLEGVRVLDLTTVVMGPYATQILGDLGADVVKVEDARGDTNRFMGTGPHPKLSGVSLNLNRNKRGISVDLKTDTGRQAVLRLLDTCDVLVTNLRPGPLERLGLDYESLRESHPRLVFCQAHGFASGTSEENRPAYDDIIQAAAGLPTLTERTTGKLAFVPTIIGDKVSGLTMVNGILAALLHRERTGRGQRVEVPMFEALLSFVLVEHLAEATIRGGDATYTRITTATRGPHKTKDGYIAILPYTNTQWTSLFKAAGKEDLLTQPWFTDPTQRTTRAEEVYGVLASVVAERTTKEWLELCDENDIPANVVPTIDEIVSDEELHRGMITTAQHPLIGEYRVVGPSIRFSETPMTVRRHAPMVGEHTREVLTELGYNEVQIEAMLAAGAVAEPTEG